MQVDLCVVVLDVDAIAANGDALGVQRLVDVAQQVDDEAEGDFALWEGGWGVGAEEDFGLFGCERKWRWLVSLDGVWR